MILNNLSFRKSQMVDYTLNHAQTDCDYFLKINRRFYMNNVDNKRPLASIATRNGDIIQ